MESSATTRQETLLDPTKKNETVADFERQLLSKVIGQNDATSEIVDIYQKFLAGMSMPGRPIGNLLFLGPTGSGKTRVVEASAAILFGNPRAFIKIDCGEFQHSHEIAKLIGSPPGYLGHLETPPILTQEAIDQYQTDRLKITFILFDEIEKANEALWQLLLGILDKAILTLGNNCKVDLSRCVIFMTSNLGATKMSEMMHGGIGFTSGTKRDDMSLAILDDKMRQAALEVAKRNFSPEFMNRLDKVVVFRTLTESNMRDVLDIELNEVRKRIIASKTELQFSFSCTAESKAFLLREGRDMKYGARHLKRALERYLVGPLSNLIATNQVHRGDVIKVDLAMDGDKLTFNREKTASIPPAVQTRNLSFVTLDGARVEVDDKMSFNGYQVGDGVECIKTTNVISVDTATKLEIVGFMKTQIVIQVDGKGCVFIEAKDFPVFLRILR